MPSNMEVFEEDFKKYTDKELVRLASADGQQGLAALDRSELYDLIAELGDRLNELTWMYEGLS